METSVSQILSKMHLGTHALERLKLYSFEATATIPLKTRTVPKTKSAFGISPNNATANKVAPIGSRRAKVAVSKDLRFERDE